eukprot:1075453-Pyramimonas_sp.AAC.1
MLSVSFRRSPGLVAMDGKLFLSRHAAGNQQACRARVQGSLYARTFLPPRLAVVIRVDVGLTLSVSAEGLPHACHVPQVHEQAIHHGRGLEHLTPGLSVVGLT